MKDNLFTILSNLLKKETQDPIPGNLTFQVKESTCRLKRNSEDKLNGSYSRICLPTSTWKGKYGN